MRHIIIQFFLSLIAFCSSFAQSPVDYRAMAQPIREPILVRYSPFPESKFSSTSLTRLEGGGERREVVLEMSGDVKGEQRKDRTTINMRFLNIEIRPSKAPTNVPLPMSVLIDLSPDGEVHDLEFVANGSNISANDQLKALARQWWPKYPKAPVVSGDKLFEREITFSHATFKFSATV